MIKLKIKSIFRSALLGGLFADAKIGYVFKGGLRLAYFLKNFTDKTYYEWALGNSQFVPSPGRNHLVTMSYNF